MVMENKRETKDRFDRGFSDQEWEDYKAQLRERQRQLREHSRR
jgi:hypothetical protein